jgi:hypothetical protein
MWNGWGRNAKYLHDLGVRGSSLKEDGIVIVLRKGFRNGRDILR